MTINPALADLTDTQLLTHLKGLRDRQAAETHPQGSAHFTQLIDEVFKELGQRVAAQYIAEQLAIAAVEDAAQAAINKAERQGWSAGCISAGVLANPYAHGTAQRDAWVKGYAEAYANG